MPVFLILCLLQGKSQTQPRFRAYTTRPEPIRLQRFLEGSAVEFGTVETYLWLPVLGHWAMQRSQGVVGSGLGGMMREASSPVAGHGTFPLLLCSLPFELMIQSQLHFQDKSSRVCTRQKYGEASLLSILHSEVQGPSHRHITIKNTSLLLKAQSLQRNYMGIKVILYSFTHFFYTYLRRSDYVPGTGDRYMKDRIPTLQVPAV